MPVASSATEATRAAVSTTAMTMRKVMRASIGRPLQPRSCRSGALVVVDGGCVVDRAEGLRRSSAGPLGRDERCSGRLAGAPLRRRAAHERRPAAARRWRAWPSQRRGAGRRAPAPSPGPPAGGPGRPPSWLDVVRSRRGRRASASPEIARPRRRRAGVVGQGARRRARVVGSEARRRSPVAARVLPPAGSGRRRAM